MYPTLLLDNEGINYPQPIRNKLRNPSFLLVATGRLLYLSFPTFAEFWQPIKGKIMRTQRSYWLKKMTYPSQSQTTLQKSSYFMCTQRSYWLLK